MQVIKHQEIVERYKTNAIKVMLYGSNVITLFLLNMNPRKLEMKEIKLNCDRFRPQSATCSRAGRRVWQLFSFAIFEDFLKKKNFKHNSKFNRTIEDLRIISRIVWNLLVKPETIPPSHVRLHQNFCMFIYLLICLLICWSLLNSNKAKPM